MRRFFLPVLVTFIFFEAGIAQRVDSLETEIKLTTPTGDLYGSLIVPRNSKKIPVALIIAGSGPTDRNGNSIFFRNDALKKIAWELSDKNIASLRSDKRGIGKSMKAMKSEADLRFEDYINDAKAWIDLLKKDKRFSKVIVIGHSEGSLIGLAAAKKADKFISLAGAGRRVDEILKEQLKAQPTDFQNMANDALDSLVHGFTVKNVKPQLMVLFRPSIQPYMLSWLKYDPQKLISELKIPVLIIQGTTDLQITIEDANLLKQANPNAKLIILDSMNHVFRIAPKEREANFKTYNDPSLPLHEGLIPPMVAFIKSKK